jgi:hypothetical protein
MHADDDAERRLIHLANEAPICTAEDLSNFPD